MGLRVAVAGATGAVGKIVLQLLEERQFPCTSMKLLASERSAGQKVKFAGQELTVEALRPEAFDDVDLVIASTPDEVAAQFVPWAVERGAVVVDESGYHRMLDYVPLVIPEVNPHAILSHQGIIASPNCSTTQMVVCLKPLHDELVVRRVVVSTYQATSGAGVPGQTDLWNGTAAALQHQPYDYKAFRHPVAFNLIPQIGSPKHLGYTSEEMKMVYETHKILEDDSIRVCPTCVRVPVTNCHSESILVETERPVDVERVKEIFRSAPGITLLDDLAQGEYPMPLNADGRDDVLVGRVRRDLSSDQGIAFWCVSDNLRKGAATNAVQIAECLAAAKLAACGT